MRSKLARRSRRGNTPSFIPTKPTKRKGTVRIGIMAQKVIPRPIKPSDSLRTSSCALRALLNTDQAIGWLKAACSVAFFRLSKACHTGCNAASSPTTACKTWRRRLSHSLRGRRSFGQRIMANNTSSMACKRPKISA